MFSWVDPAGLWNPSLCLWGFPAVPTWQPGISYHSPIVMFPKPRVMSRSLCSLSWCFDSFRTLLAHRSRLVNTEWITPNLENTRTHCLSSPGKLWAQEMRWRLSMHAHTCTHIHTTLSLQWLWFHLATQALGGSHVWLGEAVAWNLPKPVLALCLNLEPARTQFIVYRTKGKKKSPGSWKQGHKDGNLLKAGNQPHHTPNPFFQKGRGQLRKDKRAILDIWRVRYVLTVGLPNQWSLSILSVLPFTSKTPKQTTDLISGLPCN